MKDKLKEIIEKHNSIVIFRHSRPDMDAIGSQMGLYHLIKANYPTKEVYVVGDENNLMYKCEMDNLDPLVYKKSLAIIIDTAVDYLVSDEGYQNAQEVIIIDHHQNESNIPNSLFYQLSDYTSACEMLAMLAREFKWEVTSLAATYIYGGMVTDTGRFQYISDENASRVFSNASFITKFKPEIKEMYEFLYTEELEKKLAKNLFTKFELTKNLVAYRKNTKEIVAESGLSVFGVSRGMVNLMAGIKEVLIWVSFTEDYENNKIIAEIRSRNIIVVEIAKKYGGGGHNHACGASLKDFSEADKMLLDLDQLVEEYNASIK